MGLFDFLFKNRKTSGQQQQLVSPKSTEMEYEGPVTIAETSFSVTTKRRNGIFEDINFKVAGTSFYQDAIKKAIKKEKEDSFYFEEKYAGMTNKEILEKTSDEPIFEYDDALFSNCSLQLEPDNEYDPKAIAVYIESFKVGYIPKKNFLEGKQYIYGQLTGELKDNQNLYVSLRLRGGKYKINRDYEKVETGKSDYKLDGKVTIKTELNSTTADKEVNQHI